MIVQEMFHTVKGLVWFREYVLTEKLLLWLLNKENPKNNVTFDFNGCVTRSDRIRAILKVVATPTPRSADLLPVFYHTIISLYGVLY
jgi:hypothetical protein